MIAALVWPKHPHWGPIAAMLLMLGEVGACAGPTRLAAVPAESSSARSRPAFRILGSGGIQAARRWCARRRRWRASGPRTRKARSRQRAISGSPAAPTTARLARDCSWAGRKRGTRPEFKLAAGTGTGALIASFDPQLRALHTTIQPSDLYEERWLPIVVFSDALAGIDPPFHLISHDVNENMLDDIAREYRRGRLLLIGTTTLDVRRR